MSRSLPLFSLIALLACGSPAKGPPPPPAHLPKGEEVITRVGLSWIAKLQPKVLFAGKVGEGVKRLFDRDAFASIQARHGVDLREAEALFIAQYTNALLFFLSAHTDPNQLDQAFSRRVPVESKKTVRGSDAASHILERSGPGHGNTETLLIVGAEGAVLERGDDRHLRAVLRGVLGRPTLPALSEPPISPLLLELDAASSPACIFSPGPFTVDKKGVGHLLTLSTAIGACAKVEGDLLTFRAALLGDFRQDEVRVHSLLEARFSELEHGDLGRLMMDGHTPLSITTDERGVHIAFGVPAGTFFDGLHRATGAELHEILLR